MRLIKVHSFDSGRPVYVNAEEVVLIRDSTLRDGGTNITFGGPAWSYHVSETAAEVAAMCDEQEMARQEAGRG